MKATIRIICLFLSLVTLCSCNTRTYRAQDSVHDPITLTESTTASGPSSGTAEPTETAISTTITDEGPFTPSAISYIRNLVDPLLIRWGSVVVESQYTHVTNFNYETQEILAARDIIAVKVEVLSMYNKTISDGKKAYDSVHYIWVAVDELAIVKEGELAIIFPYELYPHSAKEMEENWRPQGVGSPHMHTLSSQMHLNSATPNIIPISNNLLQVKKQESQSWSDETALFWDFNEWATDNAVNAPLFRDGMTLEEFAELMAFVVDYPYP